MNKLIASSLAILAIGFTALPAAARTEVDVFVNVPPPPLRHEIVPAPRVGYVWVPGYWDWRHHRHHWVGGYWVRERPGYYYAPTRWVERDGRWYYSRGAWARHHDRDGDGVPNRWDRAPNNPYRR